MTDSNETDNLSRITQIEHDLTWLKYMVKQQEKKIAELKAKEDPSLIEEVCKIKRYKSRNERFITYAKFLKKSLHMEIKNNDK